MTVVRAQGIEEKQERQREKDRAAEAARQEKKRLTRRSGTGGSAASPLDVAETTAPPRKVSRDVLARVDWVRFLGLGFGQGLERAATVVPSS